MGLEIGELADRMESRANALRQLAQHPWLTAEGQEALLAASDLYDARAVMFRNKQAS